MTTTIPSSRSTSLYSRYLKRLELVEGKDILPANNNNNKETLLSNLKTITRTHLAKIPFENLSQHGCTYRNIGDTPDLSSPESIAHKILLEQRGGFCFELNGLFAELLQEMGYTVMRVPATVFSGTNWSNTASHMVLFVSDLTEDDSLYFVDVGFGEPPMEPLHYVFTEEGQTTVENMRSRFVHSKEDEDHSNSDNDNDGNDIVILQWWKQKTQSWEPRLKWHTNDIVQGGLSLQDFTPNLQSVLDPSSAFSQKCIVCRLTPSEKLSISGTAFKRTTRFFDKEEEAVTTNLDSEQEVRQVLWEEFGMPFESTEGLDLTKSRDAPHGLWQ